jgi:hypothetical protein
MSTKPSVRPETELIPSDISSFLQRILELTYQMKSLLLALVAILVLASSAHAQGGFTHKESFMTLPLSHVVDLKNAPEIQTLTEHQHPIPKPAGADKKLKEQIKAKYAAMRAERGLSKATPLAGEVPVLERNFRGNIPSGTPNDNSMAISNDGMVVSVVNTNIRVYNLAGDQLLNQTLSVFADTVGRLPRTFDPRAIYDPLTDRFIVVFLDGTTHDTNYAIVCFSQTNDPTGLWNCYKVPGNPVDTTWSDYPIVAITQDELFMTFNLLRDNTDWRDGFTRSIIWQIPLSNGYSGQQLNTKLYSDIAYNGKFVWSICPVHAGSHIEGPDMFFLSVRPDAEQNDTVFLHRIANTIASGDATLSQRLLTLDVKYGVPPNADQPRVRDTIGNYLQTNDARVLDASRHRNRIYFAGNTVDMSNLRAGFYVGEIVDPWVATTARGRIYSDPALDFGYPSVVATPFGAIFTFSHAAADVFPGTSAAYMPNMDAYIDRIIVKEGSAPINVQTGIRDTIERWGDYSGIQVRYNDFGTVWMSGSFGVRSGVSNVHHTWIGEVRLQNADVKPTLTLGNSIAYPNPTGGIVNLASQAKPVSSVSFVDAQGTTTQTLPVMTPTGMTIDLSDQPNGVYHVTINYADGTQDTQKIVLAR